MVKKKLLKKLSMRIFAVLMVMVLCMGSMSLNVLAVGQTDVEDINSADDGTDTDEDEIDVDVDTDEDEDTDVDDDVDENDDTNVNDDADENDDTNVDEDADADDDADVNNDVDADAENELESTEDTELTEDEIAAAANAAAIAEFVSAAQSCLEAYGGANPDDADNWVSLKEQAEALYNALVENGLSDDAEVQALWAQISALTEQPELDAEALAAIEAFKNAAKIFLDAYEADPYDIETWYPLKEQAEALYKVLVEKDLYNYDGVQELWTLVNSKAVMEPETFDIAFADLANTINGGKYVDGTVFRLIDEETVIDVSDFKKVTTLEVDKTYTIDLNEHTLDGGNKKQILRITAGNVTLTEGTLTHGYREDGSGGGVYVGGGASLTIGEDCVITDNQATKYGGGVYAAVSSSVTINGGTISKNKAQYGGGVSAYNNSSITINGGMISKNEAQYGGGVYAHTNSPVTINDGEISNNTATNYGGGVYAYKGSPVTINGGEISCNNATGSAAGSAAGSGGGVYAETGSMVTVNDGTIKNNTAKLWGGGVCTVNAAMYIYNGTISQNVCSSGDGGGLAILKGSFSMYGGVVSGNSGSYGGGIYLYSETGQNKYEISGGTISNNTALSIQPYAGGGIHVSEKCNLTLKNALVTGNTNSIADGGGGISGCPTSDVKMFLTDGGAVFDNFSENGFEVSLKPTATNRLRTFFSPFMLGGGLYNWEIEQNLNAATTGVYASNNPSDADKEKAKAANESKKGVLISDNTGAGIGTNGSVFFGTAAPEPYIIKYQSVGDDGPVTQDSQTANVGDTVTYYLTIVNETNESKTVTVTDTVPKGMEFVQNSITGNGTYNEDDKEITWSDLEVGALNSITVSFKVKVQTDGEIKNTGKLIIAEKEILSNEVIINPPTPDDSDNPSNPPDESPSSDNPDDTTTTDSGTTGGGITGGGTTDIPETDVPLADIADMDVPLADIPDEDIPLTDIPRTGDESLAYILTMMLSGMGLAWLAISEKRKRDSRTE